MEGNDNPLSSSSEQQQQQRRTTVNVTASPAPQVLGSRDRSHSEVQVEQPRRKRGRPRHNSSHDQDAPAPNRLAFTPSSNIPLPLLPVDSVQALVITLQTIFVGAGEDVAQQIYSFIQQTGHEICILFAAGSISIANLCLPPPSPCRISYVFQGRFQIFSLSGCFIRNEHGVLTGALIACLSNLEGGQFIGGAIGGQFIAASTVLVCVGILGARRTGDLSLSMLPPPPLPPAAGVDFRSTAVSIPAAPPVGGGFLSTAVTQPPPTLISAERQPSGIGGSSSIHHQPSRVHGATSHPFAQGGRPDSTIGGLDLEGMNLGSLFGPFSGAGRTGGASTSRSRPPVGVSGTRSTERQAIGGSSLILGESRAHVAPSHPLAWGGRPDSTNVGLELTVRPPGDGAEQSGENEVEYDRSNP